ncbi:MAG: hypothetical protein MUF49_06110, partial [Oculatellaceae cyanobacterium Prado106]|nr:hypothetical protein [Oculatellaceae cyanobacterium Prado106]
LVVGVCQWIALVLQFPRDDAWRNLSLLWIVLRVFMAKILMTSLMASLGSVDALGAFPIATVLYIVVSGLWMAWLVKHPRFFPSHSPSLLTNP